MDLWEFESPRGYVEGNKEEEREKLSPVALIAGAGGSVISMCIGSLFGDIGTVAGAALSSVTCSVGTFVIKDRSMRAHAKLKARKERGKPSGNPYHDRLEDLPLERAVHATREREHLRRTWGLGHKLALSGGVLALGMGSCAVTLVAVEKATGQTLSSNLGGQKQYGTTLGGYTTHSPSPAPSFPVTPSQQITSVLPSGSVSAPSSPSPDASPTPDASPDAVPSVSSSVPSPAGSGM